VRFGRGSMPFKDADKRRQYQKDYHERWYRDNGDKRRKQVRERRRKTRDWLADVKKQGECSVCGLSGQIAHWALEYHHRHGEEKIASISYLVGNGYGRQTIEDEMAKCDLICSNCHRMEHYNEWVSGKKSSNKTSEKAKAARRKRRKRERAAVKRNREE